MKKILMMLFVLVWALGACSDDENTVDVPELPDNDLNISVPEDSTGWAPGMDYEPYADNMPAALGVPVNVLVVGEDQYAQEAMHVLNNDAWLWGFNTYGKPVEKEENMKLCWFPNHKDIHTYLTGDAEDVNPEGIDGDIVVLGTQVETLLEAQRNMQQLEEKFEDYPLVVVTGGQQSTSFSEEAWNLCLRIGGLDWENNVLPHFPEWGDLTGVGSSGLTDEQKVYFHPGNVGAAYAVQQVDGYKHAEDWIIVGRRDGSGNLPGPILKDRWICAPCDYNVFDTQCRGTNLGAAYVAKIAAEIKRRLPHFTNAQIAELIFENADDLGDAEAYGHGMINPIKIWSAVENLEAQENGE